MKAGAFDYVRPQSLAEALAVLGAADGEAQLMAGGQSLVAMLNLRAAAPKLVIDIGRLVELKEVSETADAVDYGACVTHAAIEDGRVPDPSRGLMAKAASGIAYRAVRCWGTIGGSLALADPAAEWPTVLAALGAQASLRGPGGRRAVDCADFVTGVYETCLRNDEMIDGIRIPRMSPDARWAYVKFCRKSGAFADSLAAIVRDPARSFARAVLGAANGKPLVLTRLSALIAAGSGSSDAIESAIATDLAAAAPERQFDELTIALHTAIAARAAAEALG